MTNEISHRINERLEFFLTYRVNINSESFFNGIHNLYVRDMVDFEPGDLIIVTKPKYKSKVPADPFPTISNVVMNKVPVSDIGQLIVPGTVGLVESIINVKEHISNLYNKRRNCDLRYKYDHYVVLFRFIDNPAHVYIEHNSNLVQWRKM